MTLFGIISPHPHSLSSMGLSGWSSLAAWLGFSASRPGLNVALPLGELRDCADQVWLIAAILDVAEVAGHGGAGIGERHAAGFTGEEFHDAVLNAKN
jgi:hypothetical protein